MTPFTALKNFSPFHFISLYIYLLLFFFTFPINPYALMPWSTPMLSANLCPGLRQGIQGRVHPEQAKKEQRYSFSISFTSALDGGGWSTPRPGRFIPRKETHSPYYRTMDEPQGRSRRVWEASSPPGFDPLTIRFVVTRDKDYVIPAHLWNRKIPSSLQSVLSAFNFRRHNRLH